MSYEEEFDRIIRQKAEDAEFPFDEKNWEKAGRLLDRESAFRNAQRLRNIYVPAAIGVTLVTAVFFSLSYLHSRPGLLSAADPEKTQQITSAQIEKTPVSTNAIVAQNEAPVTTEEKSAETAVPVGQREMVNVSTKSTASAMTKDRAVGKTPKEISAGESNHVESGEDLPTYRESRGESVASNFNEVVSTAPVKNETEPIVESPSNAGEYIASDAGEAVIEAEVLTPIHKQLPAGPDAELIDQSVNLPAAYEDYFKKNYKKHWLLAEAGTDYNMGWTSAAGTDAKGFNGYAGIQYGRHIAKNFGVSLGVQAYNLSGVGKPFYETRARDYSFGSTASSTMVTTTDLYYAAVPLAFHYFFRNGGRLSAGVNVALLMSATNRIDTFAVQNDLPVRGSVTEKGIFQGVNANNVQLTLGYSIPVTRRFRAQAEVLQGVSDIFKGNIGTASEQSRGLRIGIQFQIFDK
jgi:hypothetical protein